MRKLPQDLTVTLDQVVRHLKSGKTINPRLTIDGWTYDQTRQILEYAYQIEVEKRRLKLNITPELESHLDNIAKWLTKGNGFGLILMGKIGNGKTTMMKAIAGLAHLAAIEDMAGNVCEVSFIDTNQITRMCRDDYDRFRKYSECKFLALDDLGREPVEVKDYGNVINPIVELIQLRYDEQLPLIVTTNLDSSQIRQRYGDRVADRLKEMMHFELFTEKSYRNGE